MAFDFLELDTLRSVEELANYQKDVRENIKTLNEERAGLPFPAIARCLLARGRCGKVVLRRRMRPAFE